jgi:uncharacterized protein YutE (UPF0331/DUF86 family)
MFETDAIMSKINIIRNCLKTIKKAGSELVGKIEGFLIDDITVLNLERAIQACIDIAHIIIAQNNYSLPATYKQSFEILVREKVIDNEMCVIMVKMVGFRNVAAHTYQEINTDILHSIVTHHLSDFEGFTSQIAEFVNKQQGK